MGDPAARSGSGLVLEHGAVPCGSPAVLRLRRDWPEPAEGQPPPRQAGFSLRRQRLSCGERREFASRVSSRAGIGGRHEADKTRRGAGDDGGASVSLRRGWPSPVGHRARPRHAPCPQCGLGCVGCGLPRPCPVAGDRARHLRPRLRGGGLPARRDRTRSQPDRIHPHAGRLSGHCCIRRAHRAGAGGAGAI